MKVASIAAGVTLAVATAVFTGPAAHAAPAATDQTVTTQDVQTTGHMVWLPACNYGKMTTTLWWSSSKKNIPYQPDAKQAQCMLNRYSLLNQKGAGQLELDGRYGERSFARTWIFQYETGLPQNGTVNAATWAKLKATTGNWWKSERVYVD